MAPSHPTLLSRPLMSWPPPPVARPPLARQFLACESPARPQLIAQRTHGDTAMTEPVFFFRVELRRRHPQVREPEIRIVAKAPRAPRRLENEPLPNPLGDHRGRIRRRKYQRQRTSIARAAKLEGSACQSAQELCVIGCVIGARSGVASRINARASAKGVDFEPRVVCNGRNARRRPTVSRGQRRRRGMPRLQQGVLGKARSRLLGRSYPQFPEAVQLEGQVRQQGAEFTQLARVTGGDNERLTRHERFAGPRAGALSPTPPGPVIGRAHGGGTRALRRFPAPRRTRRRCSSPRSCRSPRSSPRRNPSRAPAFRGRCPRTRPRPGRAAGLPRWRVS